MWPASCLAQAASSQVQQNNQETLQDIVVTATKRAESLSRVPLAVSVVSQDELRDQGITNVQSLTSAVPNLEMRMVSIANSIQVAIRGVSNSDFNQTGNPAVATYIDGVYVARTQGLAGALYDIARIEVLRGPQGTLYGRNSTGGNLNIITADPADTFSVSGEGSYGRYNDANVQATVNVPLSEHLAIRAAAFVHRNDGIFDTEGTTSQNYGKADDYGGRLTALWTPASNFRWRLSVDKFESSGTPGLAIDTAATGKPADSFSVFHRPLFGSTEPSNHISNLMIRSRVDWTLADGLALAYVAGFQGLSATSRFEVTNHVFDGSRGAKARSNSHELNLNLDSGPIKNVFGGSYFSSRSTNADIYHLFTVGFAAAPYHPPVYKTSAWGIFDNLTYSLSEKLRINAGLRYSSESQSYSGDNAAFCPTDTSFADLQSDYINGPNCFTALSQGFMKGKWSNLNWKAGVEFSPSDVTLAYLSVSTGFKSGGLNVGNAVVPTFKPEDVINYELGLKTRVFDNALAINSALFLTNYRNIQETQVLTNGDGQITSNAAAARVFGIEVEARWRMSSRDNLSGFFNYLHATFTNYRDAVDLLDGTMVPSLSGNYLPHAPRLSGRLQYSHQFDLPSGGSLTPTFSAFAQSKTFLREFNSPIDRVNGYVKGDFILKYSNTSGSISVSGYVYNIGNSISRNSGFTTLGHYFSDYDPARAYGIRASLKY